MENIQRPNPAKWVLVITALFAFMELMAGISLWLAPEAMLENADLQAKGVSYLVKMWAVRQFALGVILAFSALKKSIPMLRLSYLFLAVMFAGDALVGLAEHMNPALYAGLGMCLLSAAILFVLNKE